MKSFKNIMLKMFPFKFPLMLHLRSFISNAKLVSLLNHHYIFVQWCPHLFSITTQGVETKQHPPSLIQRLRTMGTKLIFCSFQRCWIEFIGVVALYVMAWCSMVFASPFRHDLTCQRNPLYIHCTCTHLLLLDGMTEAVCNTKK